MTRQQKEQFHADIANIGAKAVQMAGSVLERKEAYVALGDDTRLSQLFKDELDYTIDRLRHLRTCIKSAKL